MIFREKILHIYSLFNISDARACTKTKYMNVTPLPGEFEQINVGHSFIFSPL